LRADGYHVVDPGPGRSAADGSRETGSMTDFRKTLISVLLTVRNDRKRSTP
jgi:hypothetical protein